MLKPKKGPDISPQGDNGEYVIYPDVDRNDDVVYTYHTVRDKKILMVGPWQR